MWKPLLFTFAAICIAVSNAEKYFKTGIYECRLCPHPSVEYICKTNVSSAPCGEVVPAGTVALASCRLGYYTSGPLQPMYCIDGVWDHIPHCNPECGSITPQGTQLKRSVTPARHGEFPWYVAIYSKKSKPYMHICGGSLVKEDRVISAAHCFWDSSSHAPQPASEYAVAAGKSHRAWDNHEDDAQTSDVSEISIPARFRGEQANFQDDIAVLSLTTPIQYKPHVRPVCLDFDLSFKRSQLKPGNIGKLAFFSPDQQESLLTTVDLPYVDIDECLGELPDSFKNYMTSDKICAYSNDPSQKVCRGAGGGGLVFPATERGVSRYYLRGVASVAARDDDDGCMKYILHTEVTRQEYFIKKTIMPEIRFCTNSKFN